jgi:hypothetical protein
MQLSTLTLVHAHPSNVPKHVPPSKLQQAASLASVIMLQAISLFAVKALASAQAHPTKVGSHIMETVLNVQHAPSSVSLGTAAAHIPSAVLAQSPCTA